MPIFLLALLALRSMVRSRAELHLENLALRHQICVFQRSARKHSGQTAIADAKGIAALELMLRRRPIPQQNLRLISGAMPSAREIAQIKAEIERLEKLREECADSGIRKLIDGWVEEQKRRLVSGKKPPSRF
jgi:hypothetical protein